MLKLLFLALVGTCLAQRDQMPDSWRDFREMVGEALRVIDTWHGYRVQYDDEHNIFLFRSESHCYVVEANSERWDTVIQDADALHKFTEAVYNQIVADQGVSDISHHSAAETYHSMLEMYECREMPVSVVTFQVPA